MMQSIAAALKPRSILMASDFSEASEKALRHALAIARFYGSKFCLAHVVSSIGLTLAGPGAIAACEQAAARDAAALENSLVHTGGFGGVAHKIIVRQGELWHQLQEVMHQQGSDLIIVGTRGRRGLSKLLFGSSAEKIFRKADCPVLTFGPYSYERSWIGTSCANRTFLLATNFGQISLEGLSQAIAAANQFRAKLVLFSVVPAVPLSQIRCWYTAGDLRGYQEAARTRSLRKLEELARNALFAVKPELHAEVASTGRVSESILETAEKVRADLIMMGLDPSSHPDVISPLDWATAYDVMCYADSPVLTWKAARQHADLRGLSSWNADTMRPSDTDLIRMHGLGVKW